SCVSLASHCTPLSQDRTPIFDGENCAFAGTLHAWLEGGVAGSVQGWGAAGRSSRPRPVGYWLLCPPFQPMLSHRRSTVWRTSAAGLAPTARGWTVIT